MPLPPLFRLDIAQKEVSKTIKLCDFDKYPEPNKAKGYGRYESEKQIVWIRVGMPSHVTEFVIAHELGHSLQQVRGYPRVSLKDVLRNFKVYNKQNQLVHPDIIVRIHSLTDRISNLLLDTGADETARAYGLLTKQALEYLRDEDEKSIKSIVLPDFDVHQFRTVIEDALKEVIKNQCPPSPQNIRSLLELARLSIVYATLDLRYNPYGLFQPLDDFYKKNLSTVREFGKKLAEVAKISKLKTPDGCREIAKHLLGYLQIPQEAVGVKVADK